MPPLEMAPEIESGIARQAELDEALAQRRMNGRQRQLTLREQLQGHPTDVWIATYMAWFIRAVSWANLWRWLIVIPHVWSAYTARRWSLMALSFAFHHCRGFVPRAVYLGRSNICWKCPHVEVRRIKTWPRRRIVERRFCKHSRCGCGTTRFSALDRKLWLVNFKCEPLGKFGRRGEFPPPEEI